MARSLYAENKRVSNRKLKDELGVKLAFPTYCVGLEALWEAGKGGSAGFICTPRHPVTNCRLPCEFFAQLQAKRLTLGDRARWRLTQSTT
jgi:hypothetical protein